jgi:hypothetical protein
MKKLYIGCAILNLSNIERKEFFEKLEALKNKLKNRFDILDFVMDKDATPKEVYTHDIKGNVAIADFMLAICDGASTGMGYEMATAIEKRGIPVLAVALKGNKVSKIVLGIQNENFSFQIYEKFEDIADMATEYFSKY